MCDLRDVPQSRGEASRIEGVGAKLAGLRLASPLLLLLTLCWLAFALRVHKLEARSLWVDEGISLCRTRPLASSGASTGWPAVLSGEVLIDGVCATDPTPPLYYILLAGLRAVAGESVFSLRLVSVWVSVFSIPLLFVLGRRLFGRPAGLAAAFLGALSPYWVWYTQVARPDSLLLTTTLLSVLALHHVLEHRRYSHRRGMLWLLATIAMLYTHQATLWVLAFELLAVAVSIAQKRAPTTLLLWATLIVLLALPLAGHLQINQDDFASYRPSWHEARQLVAAPTSLLLAGLRSLPTVLLLLAAFVWLLWYPRRARSWAFTIGYFMTPVLVSYLATFWIPLQANSRYLIFTLPPICLLQGAGAAALWRRWRPLALIVLLGTGSVMGYWLYVQFRAPVFAKDGLRAAAAYVSHYAQEDDVVVLHNALVRPVWDYYYDGNAPVEVIPHYGANSQNQALDRFQETALAHNRLWFLRRPEPHGYFDPGLLPYHANTQWIKFDSQTFSSPWLEVELDGYATAPPVVETLPDGATPTELCWPGGLRLHGWSAKNLVLGQEAEITLYWSQNIPTNDDYSLRLALQDTQGQNWAEQEGLIFEFYPAARWPTGQILAQTVRLELSPALPPTSFALALAAQKLPDQVGLVAGTGQEQNTLGTVVLARPAEPIDPGELSLQYKKDANFGEVARLLGYNLPNDTPRPGHIAFIDFYWQALATPTENWQQRTRLIDREGEVWVEKMGPLSPPEFDLLQWRAGDLVWRRVFLPLPGRMPPGEYRVEVTLLDPAGVPAPAHEIWRAEAAESVIAGPAYLDNWPLVTNPPPMPHRPDVLFGGALRLWGYDVQAQVRPGDNLTITLVWRDELPVEKDYHVFVHLMDDNQRVLGQADGAPAGWTRPTSTWRPGEYIVDQHAISIPPDAPAGAVYLWAGLYHPDGSGRLLVEQPGANQPPDRVLLDILVIEP